MGLLSWSVAKFYDAVMNKAEAASLGQWRKELLSSLSGDVLEIGTGTGINLTYYPDSVTRLILSEPDRHMRAQLHKKLIDLPIKYEVVDNPAEALPFPDGQFDAVVSTLVLCSVHHPEQALSEFFRVLKPDGKLALIEHVTAPDQTNTLKWQKRIEPFWKRCAGNCHLTRNTLATLKAGGFNCDNVQQDSMRGAVSFVAPVIRGVAEKP